MNILEEVLATRSDEEILTMYDSFMKSWNSSSAAQLRAAYILHHYFKDDDISDTLMYFIEEENEFIHSSKISHKKWDGSRDIFYSTINTLLTFKVNKYFQQFTKKQLFRQMEEGVEKENYLFSRDYFSRTFYLFLISFLSRGHKVTLENHSYFELASCVSSSLEPLLDEFMEEEEFDPIYDKAISQYNDFISNEAPTVNEVSRENYEKKRDSIRNDFLILIGICLMNKKFLEFHLLLAKAILLTEERDDLYWTLRFLEKEFRRKF